MTPVERAMRVLGEIEAYTVDDLAWPQWADLIASAIREAENEALERAALRCERRAEANHDGVMPDGGMMNCAFVIRTLKHPKD